MVSLVPLVGIWSDGKRDTNSDEASLVVFSVILLFVVFPASQNGGQLMIERRGTALRHEGDAARPKSSRHGRLYFGGSLMVDAIKLQKNVFDSALCCCLFPCTGPSLKLPKILCAPQGKFDMISNIGVLPDAGSGEFLPEQCASGWAKLARESKCVLRMAARP